MKEVIDFFRRLHDNNDRAWFDAHRTEWAHVKGYFAAFTEQLIAGIAEFDPTVRGLRVQDCTYRIARDTRFSPDKSPYKTYIGAYIAPKGKKSGFAGYYFHIEPCCDSLVWSNLLSAGLYCPEPVVLRSVREEILDNGAEIAAAIRKAKGFAIVEENKLKRVPTGFPADSEYAEMLKLKDFYIAKKITEEFLLSEGCEVVCPGLYDFLLYCTHNVVFDNDLYGVGKPVAAVLRHVNKFLRGRKSDMIRLIEQYSDFQPPCHFESTIESAKGYIGQGVKMGEGWLLTAEMVELIQHYKVNNIVCTQPFGCLPNHICGKGVMRVIKEKNPQANIVAVDYDSSASKVNQQNRIKLMLANARLIEQNSQQPKQGNTPAAPQQETVAAAPQRREQVAQN